MNRSENNKTFLRDLPKNLFSGFVVSLIALPLGLGLAMASEAPPIAGVIAAIVGGVLVSLLGGSNVTIAGPGNGLVGVLLVAVTVMGLETTYAAIIVSGVMLAVLGFLKMGKLADFFPSSAIQGMLAAIGLIILGKQFHIMLGNRISLDGSLAYLAAIPETVLGVFAYDDSRLTCAAVAGILSLLIMTFYGRIKNRLLSLVPAPMWIVLLSIGFSYFYELVLNQPNPIHPDYMISGIPTGSEIIEQLPKPDFSWWSTSVFWTSVLSITLIAGIESLLSIKAVDQLDPLKRKSNVNRDLKALGLATIASGFMGGLNVVSVIARSSVNVNNGGTNRSSNFAHAFFLAVFILLFSTQLTRIPLPALMAILVYTGYKLAAPTTVLRLWEIGKEQLLIFFTTLIVTLLVDLITGVVAGVVATFIIHVLLTKNLNLFLKNWRKPNVLMYQEQRTQGRYYLNVKHFCTFLNFYKLKAKIDTIPEDSDVVVDFSLCDFVDHTVMGNLYNYEELFHKRDGHFEIIGLDLHGSVTSHPFALKKLTRGFPFISDRLSRRQSGLEGVAKDYGLTFEPAQKEDTRMLDSFKFFASKHIETIYNRLYDHGKKFKLVDMVYSEGELITKEEIRTTMLRIKLDITVPDFTLDREGFMEKIYHLAGYHDIEIDNHSDFSRRFYLLGDEPQRVKDFFTDAIVLFFESNPYYHVESHANDLLIFNPDRTAGVKEVKSLIDFGRRLQDIIISSHK
ncbi:MAG: SulP family inorganic anion transporter [Nonlabens sp.]